MNTPQKDEVFSFSLFVMLEEIAMLQHHVESEKKMIWNDETKATRNIFNIGNETKYS